MKIKNEVLIEGDIVNGKGCIPTDGSVKAIGAGAFASRRVHEIHIPFNITRIEDGAFSGSSLCEVDVPASVVEIGDKAFSDCRLLRFVSLPENLERLGNDVFAGSECIVYAPEKVVEKFGDKIPEMPSMIANTFEGQLVATVRLDRAGGVYITSLERDAVEIRRDKETDDIIIHINQKEVAR